MPKRFPPMPNQQSLPFPEEQSPNPDTRKTETAPSNVADCGNAVRHRVSAFLSPDAVSSPDLSTLSLPDRAQAIITMIEMLEEAKSERGWRVNFDELTKIRDALLSINALNQRQRGIYSVPWIAPYGHGEEQEMTWEVFIGDLEFMREEILSRIVSGKAKMAEEAWKQFRP